MKVIQLVSLLVLSTFTPMAMAGPFMAWGNCNEDGYTAGVAVDVLRIKEVAQKLHDTCVVKEESYYECAVDPMTTQVEGELYADAAQGVSDTGYVVSTEQIEASRLNPWGVVALGLGAIVLLGGIALYARGSDDSNDGNSVSADNNSTVIIYGDGSSDSHDQTNAAE